MNFKCLQEALKGNVIDKSIKRITSRRAKGKLITTEELNLFTPVCNMHTGEGERIKFEMQSRYGEGKQLS